MIIVWGSGLYGKVDTVPGLCHVATKFGHLWYIPLIPTGSWIVLSQDGNGWQGKPIGVSFKSMLMGWIRGALVVGTIASGIGLIAGFGELQKSGPGVLIGAGVATILCSLFLYGTYKLTGLGRASHARAVELAEELGLDERGMIMIDLAYEMIDESEAEYKLKRLNEQMPAEPLYEGT
jgi:hypothetical protein